MESTPPIIRDVNFGDRAITGIGHVPHSQISVELPDGQTLETETNRNLTWEVDIPRGVALEAGDEIKVTQQEPGLPVSKEAVVVVGIDRPVYIVAEKDFENVTNDNGLFSVGDQIRYTISVANFGSENERAERIQLVDIIPIGLTFVPGSVRLVTENDNGDPVALTLPQNTSSVSNRGHSYNARDRRLEIRLGDMRLHGGESVVIEFDVTIDHSSRGNDIGPMTGSVTANRISRNSAYNITTAVLVQDGMRIER